MPRYSEPVAWLSLIDVSGPFLAASVLEDAFPQGLEKVETPRRQLLRAAYEEWGDAVDERDPDLSKLHAAWIRLVLSEALEYDDSVLVSGAKIPDSVVYHSPEHGIEVRPDFVVCNGDGVPKFLMMSFPAGTNLENPIPDPKWPSSPSERMTLLCRASRCRTGLITNGEQWMLVNAPLGDTSGYASWYARFWWQEPVTLKAFQSLLGVRRCFGPEDETLPKLLDRSLDFQEEVTTTLGEQVRRAVEVLIQSLGRVDQDRNGELLREVSPAELYEGGLTIMMRLVFVLCAEERGLLLLGDPVYDQNYAVSTLRAKLHEDADRHGIEVLEPRHDAWSRLLSVFRGIYGGIEHDALRLPALGGSLFDPDRFPFLEGRPRGSKWLSDPAIPLPIDNRTVLLLMTALQVLEQKGGAQLLSYRALDVEQIGHVYEGLLEFTAAKVPELTIGLIGTKLSPNPQITLSELERLLGEGGTQLLDCLKEITGRSLPALRKGLSVNPEAAMFPKLMVASHGDERIARRLLPFGELIRSDSWGTLLIYTKGSFAIVKGTDRRSSGTHYTPRSLTEPVIRYTLEPLVYNGPEVGYQQEKWRLKSSAEILALKICDMACGSGAFLVEACRYLGQRLVEAWAIEEAAGLGVGVSGAAGASADAVDPMPKNIDDRLLIARRLIAQSCLYGVDMNHLAVELAKLSIWLVTLAKNKPFNFLDHALRCGDSLVGLHDLEQLRLYQLKPGADNPLMFKGPLNTAIDDAIALRLELEGMIANTVGDVEAQKQLLLEADDTLARLRYSADLLVAADFWGSNVANKQERLRNAALKSVQYVENGSIEEFKELATMERRGQRMFHWPLEFPEVIVKRGGFDAFVGNPPFKGGAALATLFGAAWRDAVVTFIGNNVKTNRGQYDLCVFFYLRACQLVRSTGIVSGLATNSFAQGDSKIIGLSQLYAKGYEVIRALNDVAWPGRAATHICLSWIARSPWNGERWLDGRKVDAISDALSDAPQLSKYFVLKENAGMAFRGAMPYGEGFFVEKPEAQTLLHANPSCASVLMPYLIGDDVNSHPHHEPSRFIINFRDWPLEADPLRPGQCAADYPDLLRIVEERVKGQRLALEANNSTAKHRRKFWWQFSNRADDLLEAIKDKTRVLAISRTTAHLAFAFVPAANITLSERLVVIADDSWETFGVLQSTIHEAWACRPGMMTHETRKTYFVKEVFETFPRPSQSSDIANCAREYYRHRARLLEEHAEGLTDIYNRFHDSREVSPDIQKFRSLRVELDNAVKAAYSWSSLELGHGFHEMKQRSRFTISESASRSVLQRLMQMNHDRYAEEVRVGLQGKKRSNQRSSKKETAGDRRQLALTIDVANESIVVKPGDSWYFAYGSNMSKGRKQERTGLIRSARKAKLSNYRLAFNKNDSAGGVYANIVPAKGEEVWGVVYLCDLDAMSTLDRREGVMGGHYERKAVTLVLDSGEEIEAVTYVAGEEFIVEEGTPSREYLAFIIEGAAEHCLPPDYIDAIRARAETQGISR